MQPDADPQENLAEAGRYGRLSAARQRALVVAAMGLPYWILRQGREFVLFVEPQSVEPVLSELARFEAESATESLEKASGESPSSPVSLFVAAWLLILFWCLQNMMPESWVQSGAAVSDLMMDQGQWWRAVTALTLHADSAHWIANVGVGLLFAFFVVRQMGAGLGWLAIVLSGAFGNALNAWFYSAQRHVSIGASTAVFGALGLLTGCELARRVLQRAGQNRRQLILPMGAGLALLAYLGAASEDKQVDFMAHFWGWLVGLLVGAVFSASSAGTKIPRVWQAVAAVGGPVLIGWAWLRALL
jgi:membrane associated rhomboid family serine protease